MSASYFAASQAGTIEGRWRLVVRGSGYLKFLVGERTKFEVVLPARFVRLLRVLIEAQRLDAASPTGTGGWRLRDEIGRTMGRATDWPLPADSISTYVSTLKKNIVREWRLMVGGEPVPALLEDKTGQGWRIPPEVRIEIIDELSG